VAPVRRPYQAAAAFSCQVALAGLAGEGRGGIQIRHDAGVCRLAHHFTDERLEVGVPSGITDARETFRGNGVVAELGKAAADVLDVLVKAKDLLDHQHDRKPARPVRMGAIGGDRHALRKDLHFAGHQSIGVGRDRLGRDWLHGCGKANGQRRHAQEAPPAVVDHFGEETFQLRIHAASVPRQAGAWRLRGRWG